MSIANPAGMIRPRLGVRFKLTEDAIALIGPDGRRFLTYLRTGRATRRSGPE
nr:hypothetical protein [Tautonia rosea]